MLYAMYCRSASPLTKFCNKFKWRTSLICICLYVQLFSHKFDLRRTGHRRDWNYGVYSLIQQLTDAIVSYQHTSLWWQQTVVRSNLDAMKRLAVDLHSIIVPLWLWSQSQVLIGICTIPLQSKDGLRTPSTKKKSVWGSKLKVIAISFRWYRL